MPQPLQTGQFVEVYSTGNVIQKVPTKAAVYGLASTLVANEASRAIEKETELSNLISFNDLRYEKRFVNLENKGVILKAGTPPQYSILSIDVLKPGTNYSATQTAITVGSEAISVFIIANNGQIESVTATNPSAVYDSEVAGEVTLSNVGGGDAVIRINSVYVPDANGTNYAGELYLTPSTDPLTQKSYVDGEITIARDLTRQTFIADVTKTVTNGNQSLAFKFYDGTIKTTLLDVAPTDAPRFTGNSILQGNLTSETGAIVDLTAGSVKVPTVDKADKSTSAASTAYVQAAIAEEALNTQLWLPAVQTFDDLPAPPDHQHTYLCRVITQQKTYQCVPPSSQWLVYSDNTDVVSHAELTADLAKFLSTIGYSTTSGVVTLNQTKGIDGTAVQSDVVSVLSNLNPTVTGTLTSENLIITAVADLQGNTTIRGDLTVKGTTSSEGNVTFDSNLAVSGTLGVIGKSTLGDTQINGQIATDLALHPSAVKSGSLISHGNSDRYSTEKQVMDTVVDLREQIWNTFIFRATKTDAAGIATINLYNYKDVIISTLTDLAPSADTALRGNTTIENAAIIAASIGDAQISGTLDVVGNTTLTTLTTSGLASLAQLQVAGNSELYTLSTSGLATLAQLAVTGVSTFTGAITANGDAEFNQNVDVKGATTVNTLAASGATTLADLTVNGNTILGDNIAADIITLNSKLATDITLTDAVSKPGTQLPVNAAYHYSTEAQLLAERNRAIQAEQQLDTAKIDRANIRKSGEGRREVVTSVDAMPTSETEIVFTQFKSDVDIGGEAHSYDRIIQTAHGLKFASGQNMELIITGEILEDAIINEELNRRTDAFHAVATAVANGIRSITFKNDLDPAGTLQTITGFAPSESPVIDGIPKFKTAKETLATNDGTLFASEWQVYNSGVKAFAFDQTQLDKLIITMTNDDELYVEGVDRIDQDQTITGQKEITKDLNFSTGKDTVIDLTKPSQAVKTKYATEFQVATAATVEIVTESWGYQGV